MIEVERKRKLADSEGLKARLAGAGYGAIGTTIEVDTYYSRPDRDFIASVECLRIRQRDEFAEITYKPASTKDTHSAADIIAKPETNVVLFDADQADTANALLDVLGMTLLCRVEKARSTFRHSKNKDVTVLVDDIAGIGVFVETEVMSFDTSAAAALLTQIEHELGLTDCPVVNQPYRDLVLEYQHRTTFR